jgi:hypothetical protein
VSEAGADVQVRDGIEFRKNVLGSWWWNAPCYGLVVALDSAQPVTDVRFHLITCETCAEKGSE